MAEAQIYNELQLIDQFHSIFKPTKESKERMEELISKLSKGDNFNKLTGRGSYFTKK